MFTESDKLEIVKLKSSIASYYNLQMKKISDSKLESLFFDNCVISGGCISSLYHNEPVNDIDLYCKTNNNPIGRIVYQGAMDIIKEHIMNSEKNIKSVDSYDIDADGNKVTRNDKPVQLITENAVTLTNDVQFIYMDIWENCKKRFDYIHCLPHYDLATQKFYISETQFNAIKNKKLIPTGAVKISAPRYDKYQKRGWSVETSSIGFIAQEINYL